MKLWNPIKSTLQLPQIGTPEDGNIDFKRSGYTGKKATLEIGRDVAQFANSSGGAIIIGADEVDGKLTEYNGIEDIDIQQQKITTAIDVTLHPHPDVEISRILRGDKEILVVNIGASIPIIGVKDTGSNKWEFPRRDGQQKVYLHYRDIELMLQSSRRNYILIQSAVQSDRFKHFFLDVSTYLNESENRWSLHRMDYELLTLLNIDTSTYCYVPLSFIEEVWPSSSSGEFTISADFKLYYGENRYYIRRRRAPDSKITIV